MVTGPSVTGRSSTKPRVAEVLALAVSIVKDLLAVILAELHNKTKDI
jgi:hypothetical protein